MDNNEYTYGPDYQEANTGELGPEMQARAIDWTISHTRIEGHPKGTKTFASKKKKLIKR